MGGWYDLGEKWEGLIGVNIILGYPKIGAQGNDDLILLQARYPEHLVLIIFIRSVSRMGGPLWWYLENIEGY